MLDDFRAQALGASFEDTEETLAPEELPLETRRQFLGMTPAQRFMVALMLLMLVCLLGSFFLLVTEKVVPPFI